MLQLQQRCESFLSSYMDHSLPVLFLEVAELKAFVPREDSGDVPLYTQQLCVCVSVRESFVRMCVFFLNHSDMWRDFLRWTFFQMSE